MTVICPVTVANFVIKSLSLSLSHLPCACLLHMFVDMFVDMLIASQKHIICFSTIHFDQSGHLILDESVCYVSMLYHDYMFVFLHGKCESSALSYIISLCMMFVFRVLLLCFAE